MFFTSKQPFVANGSHKAKIIKFKIKNYFEDDFSLVNNFLNQHCFLLSLPWLLWLFASFL